jgi:hydroxymethylglutaryl-CoA synthase
LGTESAIDAAKPSITYALHLLQKTFDCSFEHIDFLDMTFACIGGTDALHQCLDYVRLRPTRKCIVVAADKAIYDSNTGGEYTQGAGAVAFLVSTTPDLISFSGEVGVAVSHDFDFYKPKLYYEKSEIIKTLFSRLGLDSESIPEEKLAALLETDTLLKKGSLEGWADDFWDLPGALVPVQREEPVYDGQFSNACFEQRVAQALGDFLRKNNLEALPETAQWIFHLPYAYQGRRMAVRMWWEQVASRNALVKSALISQLGDFDSTDEAAYGVWLKQIAKTDAYRDFVRASIAPTDAVSSKVGNLYTASIFMALLSGMVIPPDPPLNFTS